MLITFVLPAPIRIPVGGAQVVYAHAKELAAQGHEVTVVMPRRPGRGIRARAFAAAVAVRDRLHRVVDAPYYAAGGVRSLVTSSPEPELFPEGDAVIATGVQTTPWVMALPSSKGQKLYFVQGLETFADQQAKATWHLPMGKVTCADWLRRAIEAEGESVLGVVPNAIDPADFFLEQPIDSRGDVVLALYHRHSVKGPDVLIEALVRLKAARPTLEAHVFAARPPTHRMPPWVQVHIRPTLPDLRALYNRAALLLHTSRSEGWPLVPMEAAASGCAVVATANDGIQEYLEDGATMQMVAAGDAQALARAADALLDDASLRSRLAEAARTEVARYRWSELSARFEALLQDYVAEHTPSPVSPP